MTVAGRGGGKGATIGRHGLLGEDIFTVEVARDAPQALGATQGGVSRHNAAAPRELDQLHSLARRGFARPLLPCDGPGV